MKKLTFTVEETDHIRKATKLHAIIKPLLLKAEEEDQKNKTNLQILLELRDVLEHFERV